MDLEKISASIKPRNGWQSIDLGILMARTWFKPIWGAWFLFTLPIFLMLNGLIYVNAGLPVLIFWWLKPLFEASLLYYLSHALFGEFFSAKQTVGKFFKQGRIEIIHYLSFRRLSPHRSFTMPVSQLERLTGIQRSRRITLLLHKVDAQVVALIIICAHVEFFLWLSIYGLTAFFIPFNSGAEYFNNLGFIQTYQSVWSTLLKNLFMYLAMSLVAPFYVAAGFSLYINRRASLEGWDIELVFRKIAARFKKEQDSKRHLSENLKKIVGILLFIISCAIMFCPANSLAEQAPGQVEETVPYVKHERNYAKQKIKEILSGDKFHVKKNITQYKFLENLFQPQEEKKDAKRWAESFKDALIWMARSLEFVLSVIVITILLIIVYKYRSWLREMLALPESKSPAAKAPETLFGLDIRAESLPENTPEAVLTLWHQGNRRKALSLLYRSTLSRLVSQYAYGFRDSFTEQECINLVSLKHSGELGTYFQELTTQWQLLAYGHRLPQAHIIESLCENWNQFFDNKDEDPSQK